MLDRHVQHWGQEESFPCPFGLFQLKAMPFGINNVPSTLQKVMDVTIGDLRGWICIFCLADNTDTIYIFSLQATGHKWGMPNSLSNSNSSKCHSRTSSDTVDGGKNVYKFVKKVCKNTNQEVLSWWEKWINRFRQMLETSVLNIFVHLFRDFGISERSAFFVLFLFFPIH